MWQPASHFTRAVFAWRPVAQRWPLFQFPVGPLILRFSLTMKDARYGFPVLEDMHRT